jgi:uncharacterized protein (DUF486 family)
MKTIILLSISNVFMNLAWYGHLKFKDQPLWIVILASWVVALFEYIFQVPANRIGSNEWTVPQLKVLQECITHCFHRHRVRSFSLTSKMELFRFLRPHCGRGLFRL